MRGNRIANLFDQGRLAVVRQVIGEQKLFRQPQFLGQRREHRPLRVGAQGDAERPLPLQIERRFTRHRLQAREQ